MAFEGVVLMHKSASVPLYSRVSILPAPPPAAELQRSRALGAAVYGDAARGQVRQERGHRLRPVAFLSASNTGHARVTPRAVADTPYTVRTFDLNDACPGAGGHPNERK